jgi:hypothetical protein
METNGLLCSRKARAKKDGKDTQVGPVLLEQREGWSLMIFYARATRGLRRPSLDARSGRSISLHPLKKERASLEGESVTAFDGRT